MQIFRFTFENPLLELSILLSLACALLQTSCTAFLVHPSTSPYTLGIQE